MYKGLKKALFILAFSLGGTIIFPQEEAENLPGQLVPEALNSVETIDLKNNPELSLQLPDEDSGTFFLQRLSWEKAQYAVRYLVILERKNEGTDNWTEVLRRNVSSDSIFIDVSVPAGEYRYRVLSFNILNQLDNQTSWENFTVIKALPPSILSFSPSAFYFDRITNPRSINLTGENLLPDTDIYLISRTNFDENGEPLILKPIEMHRNDIGENARLIFDEEALVFGKYDIYAKNPGGLDTKTGVFTIAIAKPFDLNVSGGYAPMLEVFGQKENFLDKIFIPASLMIRVSYLPFKWSFGNLGAEITPAWSFLSSNNGNFKSSAHLLLVNFDALFQYWIIPKKLSANARIGLGVAGIFDYHFEFDTGRTGESMSLSAFSYNLGASVQWLLYKQIFIEGSLDFIHIVHSEIPMGSIRIGILGGYQF